MARCIKIPQSYMHFAMQGNKKMKIKLDVFWQTAIISYFKASKEADKVEKGQEYLWRQ